MRVSSVSSFSFSIHKISALYCRGVRLSPGGMADAKTRLVDKIILHLLIFTIENVISFYLISTVFLLDQKNRIRLRQPAANLFQQIIFVKIRNMSVQSHPIHGILSAVPASIEIKLHATRLIRLLF